MSCYPQLPSVSFIHVAVGFLVAWSPKPYYLLYALALIGFTINASAPCRQAHVGLLGAWLCHCKGEGSEPKAIGFACLQTPPWGKCPSWLWGAGQGRETQLTLFLPFLNQSSLPFRPAQPCCWLFPFLWVFALFGEQVLLCGSHFFVQGANWGFSGSPVWCLLPIFFPQSMQAALAAIISWDARGLPLQLLGPGL